MKRVLLGLGSNRCYEGKSPIELLECAKTDIKHYLSDIVFSSVYKTKAMYVEEQDDFYNMALSGFVSDDIDAFDFLRIINNIEYKYGRNRSNEIRFGPRSLYIDIELFGDDIINEPDLQIPHIRMKERAFVLIPALEVLIHPSDKAVKAKCESYLEALNAAGKVEGIEKLE